MATSLLCLFFLRKRAPARTELSFYPFFFAPNENGVCQKKHTIFKKKFHHTFLLTVFFHSEAASNIFSNIMVCSRYSLFNGITSGL